MGKVESALQLGKYKAGDVVYWIISRPNCADPRISDDDAWVLGEDVHPKVLYERKILKAWKSRSVLPKLHACDFQIIVDLLTCDLEVEKYMISEVARCPNTGEYLYANDTEEEWMPQSCLFPTQHTANKERARIKRMISRWAST